MTPTSDLSHAATRKGIFLMLFAVFLFTMMDAVAKGLVQRYPTPQVIWARFTGQAVLVMLWLGPRAALPALRSDHPWLHMLRSGCQLGATSFFFLSLGYIGLAEATALTDINPVLITLGASLFLGERLGRARIFGAVLAMLGALIVIRPGAGVFTLAALLPLACAVFYTGNALLTRFIGTKEGPMTSLLHAAVFGAVATGVLMPLYWQPILPADLALFGVLGMLGAAAQFCIIRSFSMAEASAVAPFAYVGILFASFWGALFFQQYPDGWTVIGALVIVASGLYVWRHENASSQP